MRGSWGVRPPMPLQAPRPTHSPSTWDPPQNPSFRDPPPASITLPVAPHVSLSPSPHPGAVRAHPTLHSPQPASHRSLSNRHFLSGTQLPVSEQPQAHARPLALGGASGSGRAASLLVGIPGSPAVIGGRAPLWAWPCRRWGYIEVVRRRSAGLAGGCVALGGVCAVGFRRDAGAEAAGGCTGPVQTGAGGGRSVRENGDAASAGQGLLP